MTPSSSLATKRWLHRLKKGMSTCPIARRGIGSNGLKWECFLEQKRMQPGTFRIDVGQCDNSALDENQTIFRRNRCISVNLNVSNNAPTVKKYGARIPMPLEIHSCPTSIWRILDNKLRICRYTYCTRDGIPSFWQKPHPRRGITT